MAKLYFRYGAMNSGKSTAIMQVAYNYEERGMSIVLMKPEVDTKGANKIVSRIGVSRKVDLVVGCKDNIELLFEKYQKAHGSVGCILVDEAQFLLPSQVDSLFWIAILQDIPVICYGLRTDFALQSFPASERLQALAHTLEELKTICRCGKKAICNMRIVNGLPSFVGDQIAIDGENVEYESVCAHCYYDYKTYKKPYIEGV